MAEQFQDQGGAATMDPSRLYRWLTSTLMSKVSSQQWLEKKRRKAERKRQADGRPHVVEYFHQVDDAYSHLAAQVLPDLQQRYEIELHCHLVPGPAGDNLPEPDLLLKLALTDSKAVAAHYGLNFPAADSLPAADLIDIASRVLAAVDADDFSTRAAELGQLMWAGERDALNAMAATLGACSADELQTLLQRGFQRRDALAHYSGAMFYYEGEWYWGVDRLYHLEARLAALGADRSPGEPALMPRPQIEYPAEKDDGSIVLEIYPSLRSPYTAISFDAALELAQRSGVTARVRPVLPMVMRGVPATRQKGMYIFTDVAREARAAGIEFGNFRDPIGEPVRRAYSLYPWACEQGCGDALLSAFLRAAFAEGVNTNTDRGLRHVVEAAGLDWEQAKPRIGSDGWQDLVEANRLAMYEAGLWGVPSFRLLDGDGTPVLELWGQDRLWLFAREIKRLVESRG